MGWAGGSGIASDVWDLVRKYVPDNQRKTVALKLIDVFEDNDCDTMNECERLMKDAGLENRREEEG